MTDMHAPDVKLRPLRPALLNASKGNCPSCGQTKLFEKFLQTTARCAHCNQRWDIHQADDFPAYLVILLVGHIVVPLMIHVNRGWSITMGWQVFIWLTLTITLAAALIQPIKGGVIAFQWAKRMHGFQ